MRSNTSQQKKKKRIWKKVPFFFWRIWQTRCIELCWLEQEVQKCCCKFLKVTFSVLMLGNLLLSFSKFCVVVRTLFAKIWKSFVLMRAWWTQWASHLFNLVQMKKRRCDGWNHTCHVGSHGHRNGGKACDGHDHQFLFHSQQTTAITKIWCRISCCAT